MALPSAKEKATDKDVEKMRKEFMQRRTRLKEEVVHRDVSKKLVDKTRKRGKNLSMDFSGALVTVVHFPDKKLKRLERSVVKAKVTKTSVTKNAQQRSSRRNIVKPNIEELSDFMAGKQESDDCGYANMSNMEPSMGVTLQVNNEIKRGPSIMSNSKQMPKAAPDHGRDEKDVSSFNDVSDINIAEHFLIVHQDKGNLVNNLKPPFSTIPVKKQQSKRYDLKLPSIRNAQAVSYTHLTLPTICSV
eukprot:TRINITY_DN14175_c0_g1_i6.p2 TRINITY_DN14175_c0_g1~~TRINITY_DN14175_c0_g1_i6.p2  ORF type:complete len:245 (+),score=56.90 TRINITY_DN14175_c0_g1_i6:461-1195(+)